MKVTKEIVMKLKITEADGFYGANLVLEKDSGLLFFGSVPEFETPEKAVKRLFKTISKDKVGISQICNFGDNEKGAKK